MHVFLLLQCSVRYYRGKKAMVVVNGSCFHIAIESTHETCVMLQVGEEKRFRKAGGWYLTK